LTVSASSFPVIIEAMRTLRLIAVVGTVLLLSPVTSRAATWRGKTEQGRVAKVVKRDRKIASVEIRYLAQCADGEVLRGATVFRPPLKVSRPRRFEDGGTYRFGVGGGERARARVYVRGKRRAGGVWTGDFRVRARIVRDGRTTTWCKLSKTGWSAPRIR
jgi:hypothetical protein